MRNTTPTPKQYAVAETIFNSIDIDNSGTIDLTELSKYLLDHGESPSLIQHWFDKIVRVPSASLDPPRALSTLASFSANPEVSCDRALSRVQDENGDGVITREEWKNAWMSGVVAMGQGADQQNAAKAVASRQVASSD